MKGVGDIRFAVMPGGVVRQARIVRAARRTSVHLVMELPDGAAAACSPCRSAYGSFAAETAVCPWTATSTRRRISSTAPARLPGGTSERRRYRDGRGIAPSRRVRG